ncbi:MAG: hypothetical protein PUD55_03280 [Firmicutes bacterium]|nr:hypothetical protein [Bacillota bacterium]
MSKRAEQKAKKKEFEMAVDIAARKKARMGIIIFAVTSTSLALATTAIVVDRLFARLCTSADWTGADWGMEDTELI